jgi:hypothetical protein
MPSPHAHNHKETLGGGNERMTNADEGAYLVLGFFVWCILLVVCVVSRGIEGIGCLHGATLAFAFIFAIETGYFDGKKLSEESK